MNPSQAILPAQNKPVTQGGKRKKRTKTKRKSRFYRNFHKVELIILVVEKKIFLALGGFFMVWGMIGFVTPLSNNGFTTMQIDNFCQSLSSEKEILVENSSHQQQS